ncbi:MAG: polysaccharide deacetylase family protein [Ramlibacter sp.]
MAASEVLMPRRSWRPTPLVAASIALHGVAFLLLLWQPDWWRQLLALVLLNHVLLTACGMLPRSTWLGPNLTRLPPGAVARREIAITIDDGPEPGATPAVLDILDRFQARATFFCIGRKAEEHADLCREIVRRGHSVENHSHRHRHNFAFMGPGGFRRELQQGQEVLARITGRRPTFFRAPAGIRNPLLDPVLHGLGLQLTSWTRRGYDTRTSDPAVLLHRLTTGLQAGDILLLHDGNSALTPSGTPVILEVLPRLLAAVSAAGLRPVTLIAACA